MNTFINTVMSCLFICLVASNALAQPVDFEAIYQERIRKTHLDGRYIPKDLPDAHAQLEQLMEVSGKIKFSQASESDVLEKLYFSLGRWITHNWGLSEGSRLSVYLNEIQLHHPEDMAMFIIITYHRKLNNLPFDMGQLIPYLKTRRETKDKAILNNQN